MESLDASWSGCLLRSSSDAPRGIKQMCFSRLMTRGEAVQMLAMTHDRAGYGQ